MSSRLPLRHAVALGLVQGPTELLPVSSSAHLALIPELLGWPQAELDPELRNSFEVALHAGAAAALLIAGRHELAAAARELGLDWARLATAALALAPPALVGYLLERRIERRPRDPRALAAGLALGGAAMALADARGGARGLAGAGPWDGLALGLAQALALLPGISRNGATVAAARLRGFTRDDAQALSWRAGLPVILGATALAMRRLVPSEPPDWALARGAKSARGTRLARGSKSARGSESAHGGAPAHGRTVTGTAAPAGLGPAFAAGAGAAFVSTLASSPLLRPERRGRPLLPFSLYRGGLALLVLRLLRPGEHDQADSRRATGGTVSAR